MLAGQQLAVAAAVDLAGPCTGYTVAVAVTDIPGGVHYRRVGMVQVEHYYTARERPLVMVSGHQQAGDRTEG